MVKCVKSGKWFCNARVTGTASCIVTHLVSLLAYGYLHTCAESCQLCHQASLLNNTEHMQTIITAWHLWLYRARKHAYRISVLLLRQYAHECEVACALVAGEGTHARVPAAPRLATGRRAAGVLCMRQPQRVRAGIRACACRALHAQPWGSEVQVGNVWALLRHICGQAQQVPDMDPLLVPMHGACCEWHA